MILILSRFCYMNYLFDFLYFNRSHTFNKKVRFQEFDDNWCTTNKYSNTTNKKLHFVKVRCASKRMSFNLSLSLSLSLNISFVVCTMRASCLDVTKRQGISHMLICFYGVNLENVKAAYKSVP